MSYKLRSTFITSICKVPGKIQHVLCTGNMICKDQYDELRALSSNIHIVSGDCDDVKGINSTKSFVSDNKSVGIEFFRIQNCDNWPISDWTDARTPNHSLGRSNVSISRTTKGVLSKFSTRNTHFFGQMNVDILVTGHTHQYVYRYIFFHFYHHFRCSIHTKEGKWYLDPGSITGAMKGGLKYVERHPVDCLILWVCCRETIPSFVLLAVQGAKAVAFVYELKNDNVVVSKSEYKKST